MGQTKSHTQRYPKVITSEEIAALPKYANSFYLKDLYHINMVFIPKKYKEFSKIVKKILSFIFEKMHTLLYDSKIQIRIWRIPEQSQEFSSHKCAQEMCCTRIITVAVSPSFVNLTTHTLMSTREERLQNVEGDFLQLESQWN